MLGTLGALSPVSPLVCVPSFHSKILSKGLRRGRPSILGLQTAPTVHLYWALSIPALQLVG